MRNENVELGDLCKDAVTGFEGVAIARTEWLHQCERITLQPKVAKDGKLPDNATFDGPSVILVKKATAEVKKTVNKVSGGSQDDKSALRRN